MRTKVLLPLMALAWIAVAPPASAAEPDRLREAAQVIRDLRAAPDSGIPQQIWDDADCVAVIPDMKRAAFIFGGDYGRGVMSCRTATGWSAPLFMRLAKGSWGLQIGAQETDLVLLLMDRGGGDKLLETDITLGADASVAAGPVGRSAAAATDLQLRAQILSYSRSAGVFAGVNLSGGVLGPDEDANKDWYGRAHPPREILFGSTVGTTAEAREFVNALGRDVRATTGRR